MLKNNNKYRQQGWIAPSLFYNAVVPSFTRGFYRVPSDSTGRGTYNNYYQFIQLPVLFNYQFKSRKLPLYLNAGWQPPVMLNSKSLVFDKTLRCFYSDNTLYQKKFQLSIVTGITAKINFNHSGIIYSVLKYNTAQQTR